MKFKYGDKVSGITRKYNSSTEEYPETPNYRFTGIISHDFEDGSYLVETGKEELLVELYEDETMSLIE